MLARRTAELAKFSSFALPNRRLAAVTRSPGNRTPPRPDRKSGPVEKNTAAAPMRELRRWVVCSKHACVAAGDFREATAVRRCG